MEESFDLRQYKHELDDLTATGDVMPKSWSGHGRMAIRESDAIPEPMESRAIDKMETLAEENGVDPETAARRLIEAVSERRE